jgi:hypothetical protein
MANQKPLLLKDLLPIQRYGIGVVSVAIALGPNEPKRPA